jgi:antitoxin HigA-1
MERKRKPTHPGVVIKEDILKPLNLTVTDAAKDLGVTGKALSELINEKSSLSPDMAVRIARATNTSPESWMNMQQKLDLWESMHKGFNIIPFPSGDQSHSEILEG